MKIETLESFPPESNPFNHDAYHMGATIGTNVTVMMKNFQTEECPYLIVINHKIGERIKITFTEQTEG